MNSQNDTCIELIIFLSLANYNSYQLFLQPYDLHEQGL